MGDFSPPKRYCEVCGKPMKVIFQFVKAYNDKTGLPQLYSVNYKCIASFWHNSVTYTFTSTGTEWEIF